MGIKEQLATIKRDRDRRADRQTDRVTFFFTPSQPVQLYQSERGGGETDRQIDRQTQRHRETKTDRQTQTGRGRDRQRQTDRHT